MPFKKGQGGRKPGALNRNTRDIQQFSREMLTNPDYLASLRARLQSGEAPHMETLLHHYAFGKPKDTVALETPMRAVIVDLLATTRHDS